MIACRSALSLALLSACLCVQAEPSGEPLASLGWFATLAGACWKGDHPDGKTSDTQCYATQYGKFLRGTIRITSSAPAAAYEGDSVYAWDGKARKIIYTQWASAGNVSTGEAYYEGEVLFFPDRPRSGTGEVRGRFSWTRLDGDSFRVARERREADEWRQAFAVVYRRVR